MLMPYHKLPDDAKVWIYQADRPIEIDELNFINDLIEAFVEQWQLKTQDILGYAAVYYRRFIVIMADVGSIGKEAIEEPIEMIHYIENELGIDFFQDKAICYKIGLQDIDSFYLEDIERLIDNGTFSKETLIFDNHINIKVDFENKWGKLRAIDTDFSKYFS